jgi:transposase
VETHKQLVAGKEGGPGRTGANICCLSRPCCGLPAPGVFGAICPREFGRWHTDALIEFIRASAAQAVIPPSSNRKVLRDHDTHLYKDRNLIERFFRRIKQSRRFATRYDKLVRSYMAFLHLVCTFIWLV